MVFQKSPRSLHIKLEATLVILANYNRPGCLQADLSPALKEQATNAARVEAVENAKNSAKVLAQVSQVQYSVLGR